MNKKELEIVRNTAMVLFENNDLESIEKNFKKIKYGNEFIELITENLKESNNIILSLEDLNLIKKKWYSFKYFILYEIHLQAKKQGKVE